MHAFAYYDLRARRGSREIDLLFPGWRGADETVVVLSPHDDDALLGAGYVMSAAAQEGATVHVCIYCDGSAGYSSPDERDSIVGTRREETVRAYAHLGLGPERIHRLELPDFSARNHLGWKLPSGGLGVLQPLVRLLREVRATRLLIPNGYREHLDHEATYDSGRYDGVQAGDPILADLGAPTAIRTTLIYAVWGDLPYDDALLAGDATDVRANRAVVAPYALEELVAQALGEWRSQARIIEGLLAMRRQRDCGRGLMELVIDIAPRPPLAYAPYARRIAAIADPLA